MGGQNAKLLAEVLMGRAKGQQASRGFLTKFFGAQGCILMGGAFTAWRELQIQTIAQKERLELTRLRQVHGSLKDRKNQSSEKLVVKMLGSQSQGTLKIIISAWRELFSEFRTDVEHAQLKEENLRMMLAVCEQESEMTRLKEEVCRLMEENLESAKECRRLREESLHYAQQCRHLITSGGGEPTMLPRVAALTHVLPVVGLHLVPWLISLLKWILVGIWVVIHQCVAESSQHGEYPCSLWLQPIARVLWDHHCQSVDRK